jgi:hypothetical protein
MVDRFFKYDPAMKKFKSMIGTKLFNTYVDAVTLLPAFGKKTVFQNKSNH